MAPRLRAILLGTLVLMGLASCSTGQVNSVWSDTSRPATPYRSLVLFGLTDNPKVRKAMEDNFMTALEPSGVKPRPSHHLIGDANLEQVKKMRDAVALSGAEGILVTHLIAEESTDTLPPSHLSAIPEHYRDLDDYFGRIYREVCAPDYYSGYKALRLETSLYDTETRKLVWSGRSRRLDPNSEETTISEVIATLVDQMERDGFLPASTKPGGQIAE